MKMAIDFSDMPRLRTPGQVHQNPWVDREPPGDVTLNAIFEETAAAQRDHENAVASLAGDDPSTLASGGKAPTGTRPGHQSRVSGVESAKDRVIGQMNRLRTALSAAGKTYSAGRTNYLNSLATAFAGTAGAEDAIACRKRWIDAAKKLYDALPTATHNMSRSHSGMPENPWLRK